LSTSPDLGFVALDEIANAFTFELERIERDYRHNGIPTDFKAIIEDIDCIRSQLLKRARHNFKQYVQNHPEIKQELRDKRKADEEKRDTRDWRDRVESNRQEAMKEARRDALKG
jgi:hypothetical protein